MKLTLVVAAWTLAATAGASLAHTNPALVLQPFSVTDLQSSVGGGTFDLSEVVLPTTPARPVE